MPARWAAKSASLATHVRRGKPFQPGNKAARGRKTGATNSITKAAVEAAKKTGELPRDFLLNTMRDTSLDLSVRIEAGKAAAPYFHNRLSQIEHLTQPVDLSKLTLDELREFRRLRALADSRGDGHGRSADRRNCGPGG